MSRPSWDNYFWQLSNLVATRATCPRLQVGSVIVKDKRIVATGYNGAPPGEPHCTEIGCEMVGNSCKRTIHGEINAIKQARKTDRRGSTIYINHVTCHECAEEICKSGIIEVVYGKNYKDYAETLVDLYSEHGIVFRQYFGQ